MGHAYPNEPGKGRGSEPESSAPALSEKEKLTRMVEHWIGHNGDHERSYRDWALRAKKNGMEEAGLLLEEAADGVRLQNQGLQRVLDLLKND